MKNKFNTQCKVKDYVTLQGKVTLKILSDIKILNLWSPKQPAAEHAHLKKDDNPLKKSIHSLGRNQISKKIDI